MFRNLPTATQLASGCAGAFNPCPDLGHTSRPLRAPRPPTKVARGRRRWGLAARPAGLARAPGPREALPGSHPAVGDTGGSARGDLPPQVTAGDRSHSCGAPPLPSPRAVPTPAEPGTREGRLRTVAFPPGGTCRGRPRAPSCPTHRGPGSAAARRGVPGAAWANLGRSHPGEFKRTRGARPCPAARRTGKVSARPGSLGSPGAAAPGTGPGPGSARLRGPSTAARARARGARGPRGAGRTQWPAPRGSRPWKP